MDFNKKIKTEANKLPKTESGFTLLEVITVIAIFGILTSVVLTNFNKFSSDTVLTNMAYEMALSIREAQVYGLAVTSQGSSTFDKEYGISFTEGNKEYFLFVDNGTDNNIYDTTGSCGPECVKPYILQKKVVVGDLHIKKSSGCNQVTNLHILFRRPNPEPLINKDDSSISQAQITLSSDTSDRYVVISSNGQIYVTNTSICS